MAEGQEIVKFDNLNAKQIAKEFKTTQKELKSKDLAIQQAALEKISSNNRYFVEGACIIPLINSITTKKKLIDLSKGAVEKLSQFLQVNLALSETPSEEPSVQTQTINAAFKEPQTLEFLQPLLDVFSFKEVYKKPKSPKKAKPKKGEVIPEPTEEEILHVQHLEEQAEILAETDDTKYLRLLALKCIYHISMSLSSSDSKSATATEPIATKSSLANVPGLYSKLSDILVDLARKLTVSYRLAAADDKANADKLREECLQEGTYVLSLLAFVLRANGKVGEGAAIDVLIGNTTTLSNIQALSKEPCLRFLCVDIFEVLSGHVTGIDDCFPVETVEYLLGSFEIAVESHNAIAEKEAAKEAEANAKGGKDKKKPTKGKAEEEEVVVTPIEERLDAVKFDTRRLSCMLVKQLCKIFSRLAASKNAKVIDGAACLRLVLLLSPLATDTIVRAVALQSSADPLDVVVADVLEELSITLGSLCCITEETRLTVCANGGLDALFTLLKESRAIIASDIDTPAEPVDPKAAKGKGKDAPVEPELPTLEPLDDARSGRLQVLRRVAEKAILHAITRVKEDVDVGVMLTATMDEVEVEGEALAKDAPAPIPSTTITIPGQRWPLLCGHPIDTSLFVSTEEGCSSVTKSVIDLTAATNDANLADRGNRLLSTLLLAANTGTDTTAASTLIAEAGIEPALIGHLSALIHARGLTITADLHSQKLALLEEMNAPPADIPTDTTPEATDGAMEGDAFASEEVKDGSIESVDAPAADVATDTAADVATDTSADVAADAVVEEVEVPMDLLLASPIESLYTAYSLLELIFRLDSSVIDSLTNFVTAERLDTVAELLELLGPCGGEKEFVSTWKAQERSTKLYDPRMFSWRKATEDSSVTVDEVLIRPVILDVLSSIATADRKYRTYTEGEPAPPMPPCEPLTESKSAGETVSLLVCKHCSDLIFSLLSNETVFKFFSPPSDGKSGGEDTQAVLMASTTATGDSKNSKLHVSVLDAALHFVIASSSSGVLSVVAFIEAVARSGFPNADNDTGAKKPYALRSLSGFLSDHGEVQVAEGWEWKRPCFFDDVFKPVPLAEDEVVLTIPRILPPLVTTKQEIYNNPDVWPFVAILSGILSTLAAPTSTKKSAKLAVEALIGLTKSPLFLDHSQPALHDIISATFLSLGGAVVLVGLVGRFGNMDDAFKEELLAHISYLFDRGHTRSTFWEQWAEDHKEVIELDPKTGKPIKKKEDKKDAKKDKDKKKDPKAVAVEPVIAEVVYNLESTEAIPDPNHGPNSEMWTKLLEISLQDLHCHNSVSTPLVSSIQGSLGSVAKQLITRGVDVNQADEQGLSAVMYSLLLSDVDILSFLFAEAKQTVDVNKVDVLGNPVMKYAVLSMSEEDVTTHLSSHLVSPEADTPTALFGYASLLPLLIQLNSQQCADDPDNMLDVNVCDSSGFNPLLLVVGLGFLSVKVGGFGVKICSASYNSPEYAVTDTHTTVKILLQRDCAVNSCSKSGVVALHIAAGRGDKKLVEILLKKSAHPNAVDSEGFLPIHYLAACCPVDSIEIFEFLMECSILRPLEPMVFEDFRTGKVASYKNPIDFDAFVQDVFATSYVPSSIGKRRLSYAELLRTKNKQGLNILQLSLASGLLFADADTHPTLTPLLGGSKAHRLALAIHLAECGSKEGGDSSLLTNVDDFGLTVLHAASLLCQGITARRSLTAAEKRSKRVKTYPSQEDHLFDLIFTASGVLVPSYASTINDAEGDFTDVGVKAKTTRSVVIQMPQAKQALDIEWTAMHAAIVNCNPNLVNMLIEQGYDVADNSSKLVHFMSSLSTEVDSDIASVILSNCAAGDYKTLFNQPESELKPGRPLHLAVRSKKLALVNALLNVNKVDLNAVDEVTGLTPLHEACKSGSIELVSAFKAVSDRLDLLVQDADGQTCVEEVVSSSSMHILMELITMRKNDIIERLLSKSDGDSLLMSLERAYIATAEQIIDPTIEAKLSDLMVDDKGVVEAMEGLAIEDGPEVEGGVDGDGDGDGAEEVKDNAGESEGQESGVKKDDVVVETVVVNTVKNDALKARLASQAEMLALVLDVVGSSGIVKETDHAHPMFVNGFDLLLQL